MSAATSPPDATIGAILVEIAVLADTTAELMTDATAHGTEAAARLVLQIGALADAGRVLLGVDAQRGGFAKWTAQFLDSDPAEAAT